MSGFSARTRVGGASARPLLELLRLRLGRPASRRPPPRTPRPRPAAPPGRPRASPAANSTRTTATPAGSGSWTGPLTSVTSAPAAASAAAIAWPCSPDERLAMKRTGSIASTVGPLVTSARTPASGRASRRQQRLDRGHDLVRLGHAADPGLAAGHVARRRADLADAVGRELRDVAPGRRMLPHLRVHRRRDQHRLVGREQRGRGQIVGQAVGHLGDQIRGRRRDHHQIGLARQPDVAHLGLVGEREQVAEHLVAGQARDRERGHELGAGAGQDAAHRRAALAQPADQLEALVGRDAARDDQQNPLALHRRRPVPGSMTLN